LESPGRAAGKRDSGRWQIEIDGERVIFRLLFAEEGRFGQVLLALEIINKKWQKAREQNIRLAEKRLSDWRQRGR
jgi:phage-related protein